MTSINPHYTFQYSQPEQYRFSHDSVFLARRVFERMSAEQIAKQHALDLCSGCGVVGLDYIFHCEKEKSAPLAHFDFMEIQEVYQSHFALNLKTLDPQTPCRFLDENYTALTGPAYHEKYDLILSNPPYFRLGHGKLSPSEFKNRCRFFIDSDFAALICGIESALKPGGEAFVLLRDDKDHGFSPLHEATQLLSARCEIEALEDIRGTALVRVHKRNNQF